MQVFTPTRQYRHDLNTSASRLLALPPDIRNRIYRCLLCGQIIHIGVIHSDFVLAINRTRANATVGGIFVAAALLDDHPPDRALTRCLFVDYDVHKKCLPRPRVSSSAEYRTYR